MKQNVTIIAFSANIKHLLFSWTHGEFLALLKCLCSDYIHTASNNTSWWEARTAIKACDGMQSSDTDWSL